MTKLFRIVAFLEGISYLLLLGVGEYFKIFKEDDTYIKMFGMPHGLLFIGYVVLAFLLKSEFKWNNKDFFMVLILSFLPFGTFYADKKYFQKA